MHVKEYGIKILLSLCTLFFLLLTSFNTQILAANSDVDAFVTRFYQQCLSREPDIAGLEYWANNLTSSVNAVNEFATSFVFSEEFQNQNTSDSEFVTILYSAFFNREPDTGGYNNWMNKIASGTSRSTILAGFTSAQEFKNLCEDYGITAASTSNDTSVQGFVTRFYQQCLSREPDTGGLNNWVNSLNTGDKTGDELATSFVFSEEFQNQNTSDSEFVTILYRAFFNREPDTGGYNNWMNKIASGASRSTILAGFTSAQEFFDLCEQYQISFNDPSTQSGTNSFFPQTSDTKQSISWRYRINNGQPVNASFEGISLNMRFNDLTLSVNKSDMIRKGSFSGSFSGQASGNFTAQFSENLEPNSSMTLVDSQTINIDMTISAEGVTANIDIYANTIFNSPIEWFLDNDNLDEMAYGQYDTQGAVSGKINGYVNLSAPGYGSENIPISENVISTETWSIVDKLDTYTVGGKIYNNVVVVDRITILPPGFASNYNENISMRYWVAKGIGMVKGTNQYQMLGQSLTIELVDTNLQ